MGMVMKNDVPAMRNDKKYNDPSNERCCSVASSLSSRSSAGLWNIALLLDIARLLNRTPLPLPLLLLLVAPMVRLVSVGVFAADDGGDEPAAVGVDDDCLSFDFLSFFDLRFSLSRFL